MRMFSWIYFQRFVKANLNSGFIITRHGPEKRAWHLSKCQASFLYVNHTSSHFNSFQYPSHIHKGLGKGGCHCSFTWTATGLGVLNMTRFCLSSSSFSSSGACAGTVLARKMAAMATFWRALKDHNKYLLKTNYVEFLSTCLLNKFVKFPVYILCTSCTCTWMPLPLYLYLVHLPLFWNPVPESGAPTPVLESCTCI